MATVNVKGSTNERLSEKAAERHTTIDDFVAPVMDQPANGAGSLFTPPDGSAQRQAFEEWMQSIARRANRYPDGFVPDDSRESIYDERGE